MRSVSWIVAAVTATVHAALAFAFTPELTGVAPIGKKQITSEADNLWKRIELPTLSPDGRWVAYNLTATTGESELVVRDTRGATQFHVSRGGIPQPKTENEAVQRMSNPQQARLTQFSSDSRFVFFTIAQSYEKTTREAELTLAIMSLPEGTIRKLASTSSFLAPQNSGRYIAYTLQVAHEKRSSSNRGNAQESVPTEIPTNTLVLQDLSSQQQIEISDVSSFAFDSAGRYLAYVRTGANLIKQGVYERRLSDGQTSELTIGLGDYRNLTFDSSGEQIAFLSNRDATSHKQANYSVYYARRPLSHAEAVVRAADIEPGWHIAPDCGVRFSQDGDTLEFFLRSVAGEKDNEAGPAQVTDSAVEIWKWDSGKTPGNQWRFPEPSYLALYRIADKRWVQLGDEAVATVLLSADARHAVGLDQRPYAVQGDWGDWVVDVYLIDVMTGSRRLLRKGLAYGLSRGLERSAVWLSATGRYILYFENRRWFSYDLERDRLVDLTGSLLPEAQFVVDPYLLGYSSRRTPLPIGIAGWSVGDRRVLLYDQYDIWEVDPSGASRAINLTAGVGRKQRIIFRLWPDDIEATGVSHNESALVPTERLLLTALDRATGTIGVWQARLGTSAPPVPLTKPNRKVTLLAKSGNPPQYLATEETFSRFPDLWVGSRFDRLKKISDANPQQSQYRWGMVELVEWTSSSGVPVKGLLYKPEDFDPSKKYPMIVNIYGIYSINLHKYSAPAPESTPDVPLAKYLSRGYVILKPDIVTTGPYPGEAALASVVPGVRSVTERGFVDPRRVGLVGHSWGAREVIYILTRTDIFRCAIEGAGGSDMLSDYARVPAHYERGGDMLGYSPWENLGVYLSNSPVLAADRINTPLLIIHNERDSAVPMGQGTELFGALRRNGKEVYLLNYKGEGHQLMKYDNQVDLGLRMGQFLDYFLKGGPRPEWVTSRGNGDLDPRLGSAK